MREQNAGHEWVSATAGNVSGTLMSLCFNWGEAKCQNVFTVFKYVSRPKTYLLFLVEGVSYSADFKLRSYYPSFQASPSWTIEVARPYFMKSFLPYAGIFLLLALQSQTLILQLRRHWTLAKLKAVIPKPWQKFSERGWMFVGWPSWTLQGGQLQLLRHSYRPSSNL